MHMIINDRQSKEHLMNREIRKTLKDVKTTARKAFTKAQATAVKNAKATAREVMRELEPEVTQIKTDLSKAVKSFKRKIS